MTESSSLDYDAEILDYEDLIDLTFTKEKVTFISSALNKYQQIHP